MSLLQRGCIKSIQLIKQWVKFNDIGLIQVDINQVDPTRSIVLFIKCNWITKTPDDNKNYTFIERGGLELYTIESRCVKFGIPSVLNSIHINSDDNFYYVVFQLVEFY